MAAILLTTRYRRRSTAVTRLLNPSWQTASSRSCRLLLPAGSSGQVVARNSAGDGYELVDNGIGAVTHIESGATYNNNVITVSTAGTVRGGDGILFAVPTPFGSSATQAISLAINGQSNSEHPLHDRNGDALHEDDLTANSLYIAISDADSWDILVLPDETGSGAAVADNRLIPDGGTDGQVLTKASGTDYDADWEDATGGSGGGNGSGADASRIVTAATCGTQALTATRA